MSRQDAIGRIRSAIEAPETVTEVTKYVNHYDGRHFDTLCGGGNRPDSADHFTADDILAVGMLSVTISAEVVILLLEDRAADLSGLLEKIPAEADIRDASDEELTSGPAYELWHLLDTMNSKGDTSNRWVTAGKLLARKRPALVPVYDRLVRVLVQPPKDEWWRTARDALIDQAVAVRLAEIREQAEVGSEVTDLRLMDIALWMAAHR